MNIHAQNLGKMGKGKPKNFSAKELQLRRERMICINKRKKELKTSTKEQEKTS